MKKRIRLTESDFEKLIRRVIKESDEDMDISDYEDMEQSGENIQDVKNYLEKLFEQLRSLKEITNRFLSDVDGIDHFSDIIENSDLDEDEKDDLLEELAFLYGITDDLFEIHNNYFRKD
jgi:hypothetical protein